MKFLPDDAPVSMPCPEPRRCAWCDSPRFWLHYPWCATRGGIPAPRPLLISAVI